MPGLPENKTLAAKLGALLESPVTWGAITFILAGYADEFRKWLVFTGFFFLAVAVYREHFFVRGRWTVRVVCYALTLGILFFVWLRLPPPSEPPSASDIADKVVTKLRPGNGVGGDKSVQANSSPKVQSHPFFTIGRMPSASQIADEIVKKLPSNQFGQRAISDDLRGQLLTLSFGLLQFSTQREGALEQVLDQSRKNGEGPQSGVYRERILEGETQSQFNGNYYPQISKVLDSIAQRLGVDGGGAPAEGLDKFPEFRKARDLCAQWPAEQVESGGSITDLRACARQLEKLAVNLTLVEREALD
ncbi:MAG TPA: hypothetical protein VGR72_10995 [Candidatus Acidoferrales bacterium]|nr:hypothetical protein [Candidatus Acidoferrales bacterium]